MKKFNPLLSPRYKALLMLFDVGVLFAITATLAQWRMSYPAMALWLVPGWWVILLLVLLALYLFGTYDLDNQPNVARVLFHLALAVAVGVVCVVLVNYIFRKDRSGLFGRGILFGSLSLFFLLGSIYRSLLMLWLRQFQEKTETLFILSSDIYNHVQRDLIKNHFLGRAKFLLEKPIHEKPAIGEIIGTWQDLNSALDRGWSAIVVGFDHGHLGKDVTNLLMSARMAGHNIIDLCNFYEGTWQKVPVFYLAPQWFVLTEGFRLIANPLGQRLKRIGDLVLAGILSLLALPFMLLTALFVRLESRGPVLFRQVRTGHNGREFIIYKFRSMYQDAEKDGAQWAQKNDSRVTKVGRFIRLTRLDELPQFINVIRGDMSFVGPRPERPEFNVWLEKELPYYNMRHAVRPGLTGWAQILYPYGAGLEDAREKLQYELYYIKHYSIFLDFLIVFRTFSVVVLGRGR